MVDGARGAESEDDRPAQAFRAGLVLDGRYRLERPLGEGGMGAVWVAHQLALEREVAIKVLHVGGDGAHGRLRLEALALAAVHHPAVVQVHDFGETEAGVPYVVMELVRGESLGAYLHRVGPLPAEQAVALVLPLLEGLAAAHRAGVIHRDIKPDNVVLASGPAGVAPKLLDFGIARMERPDAARLTADGNLVGTPAYMAPEQLTTVALDERVDVWGVGVLLYELITGVTPFAAPDMFVVIRRVLDTPPPYPRSARGLDGRLWSILMAALRKAPAERTPSALALRDALTGWLEARSRPPAGEPSAPTLPAAAIPLAPTVEAARPAPDAKEEDAAPSFDALIRDKLGGR